MGGGFSECFMTALSPGIVATTMLNQHYDSHEAYLMALAKALSNEYRAIHDAGLILQIDAPDLAMERHRFFDGLTEAEFLRKLELHVCWGNNDGPHIYDIAMAAILPELYRANAGALSIEFANPRHQHEYDALRDNPLPAHMLLMPGVLDTATNFVEHPQVVAQKLEESVSHFVSDLEPAIHTRATRTGQGAGARHKACHVAVPPFLARSQLFRWLDSDPVCRLCRQQEAPPDRMQNAIEREARHPELTEGGMIRAPPESRQIVLCQVSITSNYKEEMDGRIVVAKYSVERGRRFSL